MICPKCGILVPDSRSTCQSCGAPLPAQSQFEEYTQDPSGLAPQGRDAQYQQPAGARRAGPRNKKIVPVVIIILVIVIVVAVVGVVLWRQGVHLKLVDYDTEGLTLKLSIKNEGTETAKNDKIQIRCNGEDTFDWKDGDIERGETVDGEVELGGVGLFYFLSKIEIIYDGEVQDSQGY